MIIFATGYLFSFPFLSHAPFDSLSVTREPPLQVKANGHATNGVNGNGHDDATRLGGLRVHNLDPASSLASAQWRAVAEVAGSAAGARIRWTSKRWSSCSGIGS